ncbi:MAG: hypothetical protein LBV41_08905 [Cytophagaceae bacterium]|jgi:transcriptional regulator with PAS, ATPase and Fis domain|nr:hypothetical protein [Cytophagaceae bacterium]
MFPDYFKQFDAAITVSDAYGNIIWMNDRSMTVNKGDFTGKSLFDCHPEPARTKLRNLFVDKNTNAYTIEKGDIKKLIYQSPWYENGNFAGYIELSLEIPFEMPHYVRKPKT